MSLCDTELSKKESLTSDLKTTVKHSWVNRSFLIAQHEIKIQGGREKER